MHILESLNAYRNLTSASLARDLDVFERTVKRCLAYLWTALEMDIVWAPALLSYYCEKTYEYIPLPRVTGEKTFSLALASKTFVAWLGTALRKALESLLATMAHFSGGSVPVSVSEILSFSSTPQIGREDDPEHTWLGPLLVVIRLIRALPGEARSKRKHEKLLTGTLFVTAAVVK